MQCKICQKPSGSFAQATILGQHEIAYFRCEACGFIQTEEPYWLEQAYAKAISDIDLGTVNRAMLCSRFSQFIVLSSFNVAGPFVDYGGGYGLFTRLMRDLGYNFYRYDTYCENTLAIGFDVPETIKKYELLTAFEVFEHLVNPLEDIEKMLQFSDNLLFTTELVPPHLPKPDQWWYYTLATGQHISLYSYATLATIAQHFGLNFLSNGSSLHLLSKKHVSPRIFKILQHKKIVALLTKILRRNLPQQSLLNSDFTRISGLVIS